MPSVNFCTLKKLPTKLGMRTQSLLMLGVMISDVVGSREMDMMDAER